MSTPLMGYYAPATSADAGTWGDNWNNTGSGYLDVNFAGISTIPLSASNVLLTAAQARNQMLLFTGTLLTNIQISPDAGVLWNGIRCVQNNTTGNFSITLTNGVASAIIPAGRIGLLFIDATYGVRFVSMGATATSDIIPAAYPIVFYSAAPPAGWTQYTSLNDYALRITNSVGGGTGGSVDFSTLFGRTSVDPYTLQIGDIPAHNHPVVQNGTSTQGVGSTTPRGISDGGSFTGGGNYVNLGTSMTGGGGAHAHAIDMRVKYANMILATH